MHREANRISVVRVVLFVAVVFVVTANSRANDELPGFDSSYKRMLDVWLQARVETLGIPGLAVAVVYDQDVVYRGCFGFADVASKAPVSPSTKFRIASQSKLFTALAIMQLRDDKKLRLDDPVSKHLDWVHVKNPDGTEREITIRQLLTHTSGLSSIALHSRPLWSNFQFPTDSELRAEMAEQVLLFRPGQKLKYSNLGITLLGQVVEPVSERPFAEYVDEKLLTPLGLDLTSVTIDATALGLATGYARLQDGTFEALPFVDAKAMAPATGMSSSLENMARFVTWQLRQLNSDKTEIMLADTLRDMQRPHRTVPDGSFGQGLGFNLMPGKDRTLVGHEGQYPGFYTSSMISVSEKTGVVILSNGMAKEVYVGKPNSLMDAIFATVADALADARDAKIPDPRWRKYYGEYRSIWGRIHVLPIRGDLTAFYLDDAMPSSRLYRLKPMERGANRFLAVQSDDHFYLREEFSFRDFRNGIAMTLRDPGADFERAHNTSDEQDDAREPD